MIIGGVPTGEVTEQVLALHTRDVLRPAGGLFATGVSGGSLQPAGWGSLEPAGDVQVSVDAPNVGVRNVQNVFPAGDPPAPLTAEQALYAHMQAMKWGALGAVLGAAVSGGVCWWMCKSRANPGSEYAVMCRHLGGSDRLFTRVRSREEAERIAQDLRARDPDRYCYVVPYDESTKRNYGQGWDP